MWEIPEAKTIAAQWNKEMAGKTVRRVEAGTTPHKFAFFFDDPANYDGMLQGKTLGEAVANGGLVESEAEGVHLVFGDGVNLRYLADMKQLPPKYQMAVWFEDGSGFYCTISMYGGMWVFPEGAHDNEYYRLAREKVNPLEKGFDWAYFSSILQEAPPKLSAKALLATQQRIPGVGNGVVQDILFQAGINPMTKVKDLNEDELRGLFDSLKKLLRQMTEQGGRDVEKDIYGNPGGYQTILSKKTFGHPCPRCGGEIVKKAYLGGNVYYCPACQPVK